MLLSRSGRACKAGAKIICVGAVTRAMAHNFNTCILYDRTRAARLGPVGAASALSKFPTGANYKSSGSCVNQGTPVQEREDTR